MLDEKEVTQFPNAVQETKTMGNKKVIISLFAVLLTILGGYFLLSSEIIHFGDGVTPTPSISSITFIKYTNTYYDFELEIPNSWNISENTKENGVINFRLFNESNSIVVQDEAPQGFVNNQNNNREQYSVGEIFAYRNSSWLGNSFVEKLVITSERQKALVLYVILPDDNMEENEVILRVLGSFRYLGEEPKLTELISYDLPSGYVASYSDESEAISISCLEDSDFQLILFKQIRDESWNSMNLQSKLTNADSSKYASMGEIIDMREFTASGLSGVKFFYRYEKNSVQYHWISENNYWIAIVSGKNVSSMSSFESSQHYVAVDSIISSIELL